MIKRTVGFVIVPIKDDDGKVMQPSLWRAWQLFSSRSRTYENIYVWKTKTGAIKALRRIFGRKDRKAMKVCEIRIRR